MAYLRYCISIYNSCNCYLKKLQILHFGPIARVLKSHSTIIFLLKIFFTSDYSLHWSFYMGIIAAVFFVIVTILLAFSKPGEPRQAHPGYVMSAPPQQPGYNPGYNQAGALPPKY